MTTQQTTWTEYTGSDEQIVKILSSKNGYLLRYSNGRQSGIIKEYLDFKGMSNITHYWIIPDDPLREMKIRQAETGQPVWIKMYLCEFSKWIKVLEVLDYEEIPDKGLLVFSTTSPLWNIPNAEYSFTKWED